MSSASPDNKNNREDSQSAARLPATPNRSPSHQRSFSESGSRIPQARSSDQQQTPWRPSIQGPPFDNSSPAGSTRSDSPFNAMSPSATDRVFPIRSVVSVDPKRIPLPRSDTFTAQDVLPTTDPSTRAISGERSETSNDASFEVDPAHPPSRRSLEVQSNQSEDAGSQWRRRFGTTDEQRTGGARQNQAMSDNRSVTSNASRSESLFARDEEADATLVTARFKHVVTEDGHAVIIGRDGDTLQRCEDEPIHIPGAVQGFGLLIALKEVDERFEIRIVSENSKKLIGYTPKQLFELESFCDILPEDQIENLLDHVDFIRDEDLDPATHGPEVFTIMVRTPSRKLRKLWCAIHLNEKNHDLIICEFELEDDPINPLAPMNEPTPEPPEDTLDSAPTADEFAESTINASKPLRMLRNARKRKGEAAAMEVFNVMSQVQEQLASASTLERFLKILVGVVKELTGFHRVMIYQFDSSWNGRVVTELVDPRATRDLYKGLNFPASDIPKQARDLYKINKVRLLYDREQETARLVCRTAADLENPLDLTFAYLRAMSPIHIKYLGNMAVRSSMSISIDAFNELWGLIACHSYGSKGMRVSFPIRKMCRLVGDSASRNIERLSSASRLQARKLINTVPTKGNPSGYIIASSEDLLNLFDADCGLLSIHDETKILGKLEQTQEALVMVEYLKMRKITSVMTSTDITLDFPDLRYQPGFSVIAGLLLVPLTVSGRDFIVFFRRSQTREVKWAGNPYEKFVQEGTEGYLEPRKSFKTWSETVVGKCKEWTEEQIETAAVLCLVYGKFIEVWRQKETAVQNSQLTRILLANSAHEVRTPLNAIINYLEIALEGQIDQETRENLSKSHSASKSLIYVINDLLDLTKTEEGNDLIKDEVFDLPATVKEAADQFAGDAKRKSLEYETIVHPGLPRYVVGDQRRVRQVVANVVANAIQHTICGTVRIELWLVNKSENSVDIDIVVQDTGVGMSPSKLDALFNDLEQVQTELENVLPQTLAPDVKDMKQIENPGHEKRVLGLGLALVARILRNMNGQLRLKSEEGKGSRFVVQVKFELPPQDKNKDLLEGLEKAGVAPPANQPSTPPVEEGEVMLIHSAVRKAVQPEPSQVTRRKSASSMTSMKSFKSGSSGKSEVDRLIDAIQGPVGGGNGGGGGDSEVATRPSSSWGHVRPGSTSSVQRPSTLSRSHSQSMQQSGSLATTRQVQDVPGEHNVMDSRTPIKPVRLPDEESADSSPIEQAVPDNFIRPPARVLFDVSNKAPKAEPPANSKELQVLVAEDDPINSKIMKKRLEKVGHDVHLTINGEECASLYGDKAAFFDVVLMDMQMPIVDGLTSTKMIRSFEKSHANDVLSARAAANGRVPIFAVSASLVENERQTYINAGFDGWILKPVDFKRMSDLLHGIVDETIREKCVYQPGKWEAGGWFCKRQSDLFAASTKPSPSSAVTTAKGFNAVPAQSKDSPQDEERDRLRNLNNDAVHADSRPSNLGQSGNIDHSVEGS